MISTFRLLHAQLTRGLSILIWASSQEPTRATESKAPSNSHWWKATSIREVLYTLPPSLCFSRSYFLHLAIWVSTVQTASVSRFGTSENIRRSEQITRFMGCSIIQSSIYWPAQWLSSQSKKLKHIVILLPCIVTSVCHRLGITCLKCYMTARQCNRVSRIVAML